MSTKRRRRRAQTGLCASVAMGLLTASLAGVAAANPAASSQGFVDDLGHAVDEGSTHKPLQLVVFGYTSCPDVCPLTLVAVHRALVALGPQAAKIDPVFVTVDPERDTLAVLHQYVEAFDGRIRGYRGDADTLAQFAARLHVRYWRESTGPKPDDYGMSHTAALFVLTPDGRVAARIEQSSNPEFLTSSLVTAMQDNLR